MKDINEIAKKTIEYMREGETDKGQVFVTESEYRELNMERGEFTLFRTLFNQDINIWVYKNRKKGQYYSNQVNEDGIGNAIENALLSAQSGNEDEAYDIAPYQGEIKAKKGIYEPDMDSLFERAKELAWDIKKNYPNVMLNSMTAGHYNRHMAYENTNGTKCDEYIGYYSVNIEVSGHEGDKTTSALYTGFATERLDTPFIDMADIRQVLETAQAQLSAKPAEEKFKGTMIVTPACMCQFLWYIIQFISDDAILDKSSIWLDCLEKQVADKRFSLRLDNEDKEVVCGETLTVDGFKSEPFEIIRDGILKNFRIGYYVSKKTGYERWKNGQANCFVKPGDKSIEEIIKNTKEGIILGGFSGGAPAVNGDFSGVAKNSFLVKDGAVQCPLTETMVSGNLAEMLMNLKDISSETLHTGGDVVPYMAFDGITISGK